MESQTIEKILVGALTALITAIINQVFSGQVDYLWVIGGFFFSLLLYWAYQGIGYPFIKFRVTNIRNGQGLLFRSDNFIGKNVGEAWQFTVDKDEWAIYGPYLLQPLHKGKYRAAFRIKVDDITGDNRPAIEIDVASRCRAVGDKRLTGRAISTRDFKSADKYQVFLLDFFVISDENDIELRIFSRGSGHTVTLDYIQLSRRLV